MKKIIVSSILLVSSIFAMSNVEVAQKSDDVMSGFVDSVSQMEMKLINARGQEKIRTMSMKVLEGKVEDKSLMEFTTPADVKGTKFLNYEHVNKDDDQWLYLPALKRVKRISSKKKSGAFMGSEFSYEDLSAFNVNKYTYENGEAQESGSNFVVESVPVSKHSGYTKRISYVDKESFLIQKVEYYDRKKQLLKTATFSEYKKFGEVNRIGKIHMQNIQNDKTTILVWSKEKIKTGLTAKKFHKRYLK
ncbi:outer membrane lipoprotein-sorting protein [Sulfurimonas sp.]|uniref:outer membrane lipoprotein-sorting protein n=1 Tax=Sulfurimonas sp. TaxID=2022749 RepID=UPI0039E6D8BF